MKGNVSFILEMFFKMLKESDLGFSVDVNGNFIFNDRNTDEKLYILKEDIVKFYDEL